MGIVATVVKMAAPFLPIPGEYKGLIVSVVGETEDVVTSLTSLKYKKMTGPEKLAFATREVAEALDDLWDYIPVINELSSERQTRIINGVVELILFINEVVASDAAATQTKPPLSPRAQRRAKRLAKIVKRKAG